MTRLAATLGTDVRVQFRNGFYVATAFVVACSIALLRWLPADVAALLLPVVLLENIRRQHVLFRERVAVAGTRRGHVRRPERDAAARGRVSWPPRS